MKGGENSKYPFRRRLGLMVFVAGIVPQKYLIGREAFENISIEITRFNDH